MSRMCNALKNVWRKYLHLHLLDKIMIISNFTQFYSISLTFSDSVHKNLYI